MSKLNGMQIFELMSDLNDNLIAESAAASLLLGSAAVGTAAMAGSATTSAAAPVKAGFGAWLAKGGWVALVAGAVAAAGVTVGMFALGGRGEPQGATPPVSETASQTEAPTEQDPEAPTGNASETPTEEPETQAPDTPSVSLPLRITDFSDMDLSLFTPSQGKVSVTPEGKLLLEADWVQGSHTSSSVTWVPHALMPYAHGYAESAPYTPGALVMKYKVVNGDNGQPDFKFKGEGDSDVEATYTRATVYEDWNSEYRYLILRTDSVDSYMSSTQTQLTMTWIYLGNNFQTSDGRSMTIEEMTFYPSTTEALLGFADYLEENGIVSEILFSGNDADYSIVYQNPQYTSPTLHIPSLSPDGLPVKEITNNAYQRNTFLFALTVDEGVEYIRYNAFDDCTSLVTAHLPDSLVFLDQHVFSGCSSMTEIHLGSGLRVMEYGALPLTSEVFTDIYYNGTVAEWHRIVRRNAAAEHPITVHCTDGEVDYSDPAPENLPSTEEEKRDLTALLANAPLMELLEGEAMVSCEARVIRLKQGRYGAYKEFVLRYGLFQKDDIMRYGFDVLSMEDGSILAKPAITPAMYRAYGTGGMLYFEAAPAGDVDAMVLLYDYGPNQNGDLGYRTQYYSLAYDTDGTVKINIYYHISPGLTEDGYVDKRMASRELVRFIRVLSTLSDDVNTERYGAHGYYLMSTAPDGVTTLYTAANAPLFDPTLPETVSKLTAKDVLDLPAFYEKYGPRKRE